MRKSLPTLLLATLLTACYEPKEGCLDIGAKNYDVTADDACGDCCTFPTLKIQVQHRVDLPDTSLVFSYAKFYPNPGNPLDSFVIDRARFFISDIKLVRENGEEIGITDTLRLEAPTGNILSVEDSFMEIDRDNIQARTVGSLLAEGSFTGVKLTIGLEEFLLQTDPTTVPVGHPLSITNDSVNYDPAIGYIPEMLIFRNDTTAVSDSLEIRLFETQTAFLPFESAFFAEKGFDITLTLKVDYLRWFGNLDLENASLTDIQAAMAANLLNAISVTEIKQ